MEPITLRGSTLTAASPIGHHTLPTWEALRHFLPSGGPTVYTVTDPGVTVIGAGLDVPAHAVERTVVAYQPRTIIEVPTLLTLEVPPDCVVWLVPVPALALTHGLTIYNACCLPGRHTQLLLKCEVAQQPLYIRPGTPLAVMLEVPLWSVTPSLTAAPTPTSSDATTSSSTPTSLSRRSRTSRS